MRRQLALGMALGMVAAWVGGTAPARAQDGPQPELPKEHLQIVTRDGRTNDFDVEIARTGDQQTVGLMFRTSVPADGGMLFIWPQEEDSRMWMRNTVSALDMVFINADGSIRRVVQDTVPFSEAVIDSNGRVRATLELKAGVTKALGIHAGDKVVYPLFGTAKAG